MQQAFRAKNALAPRVAEENRSSAKERQSKILRSVTQRIGIFRGTASWWMKPTATLETINLIRGIG